MNDWKPWCFCPKKKKLSKFRTCLIIIALPPSSLIPTWKVQNSYSNSVECVQAFIFVAGDTVC